MKITHYVALYFHPIFIPFNQLFGAIYAALRDLFRKSR